MGQDNLVKATAQALERYLPDRLETANTAEMLAHLIWLTRANEINGPAGTTAYVINAERMKEARALVAEFTQTDGFMQVLRNVELHAPDAGSPA